MTPPVVSATAEATIMLSVITISFRAAGSATPFAEGVVLVQNWLASTVVAVVAATKRDVELVTPRATVEAAPVTSVVQNGTSSTTVISPVTVKMVALVAAWPKLAAPVKVRLFVANRTGLTPGANAPI